jgi:hypothetical protein
MHAGSAHDRHFDDSNEEGMPKTGRESMALQLANHHRTDERKAQRVSR